MPTDLAKILRRNARRSGSDGDRCSSCSRAPLAGEMLYELESHSVVCQLCLSELPESKRATIGSQRVHASQRPLAVAPRAA